MAADKVDLKKELRPVYSAKQEPHLLDVPEIGFLMVDGLGDPNTSAEYAEALAALYAVAYKAKFASKAAGRDFVVAPLEGLWWADDMDSFADGDRSEWQWTMMIALPAFVDEEQVAGAIEVVAAGDPPPGLDRLRYEGYEAGRSAQVMHIGPYADEAPTIQRLHDYIEAQGLRRRGRHQEIYLSDPRRTVPDKMKTIIRQPVG